MGTEELWWISPAFIWVFGLPFILFYRVLPESPIYLKNLGRFEESEFMINSLYPKQGEAGLDMQVASSQPDQAGDSQPKITLKDLKTDSNLHKAMIYILILTLGENFTGMLMLSFYTQRVILTFNLSKFATQLISIALAALRLVGSLAGSAGIWQVCFKVS